MATLLHIDSSSQSDSSVTRKLSKYYVQRWLEANPGGRVIARDLNTSGIQLFQAIIWLRFSRRRKL